METKIINKTPFHSKSIINLPNINLGQLQICLVLAGLLSVVSCVCCTLFLSAKCKDALSVLLISMAVILIPILFYTALGVNWISAVLPSAGVGLQNNFLYQLINFDYLHIGGMSFWTPYVILISAAVETPVFLFLAVRSYCKHQVVKEEKAESAKLPPHRPCRIPHALCERESATA